MWWAFFCIEWLFGTADSVSPACNLQRPSNAINHFTTWTSFIDLYGSAGKQLGKCSLSLFLCVCIAHAEIVMTQTA